jgi:hemoglobin/transferrin/lactoferrin receptor protein
MKTNRHAALAAALGLLAPSLHAQAPVSASPAASATAAPIPLDALVVSATRTERRADETPGSISALDLREFAAATLGDLLRTESLVSVPFTFSGAGNAYGRGGANSINLRGVEGNRVLLQMDGMRVPDEFRLGGSEPMGRDYFDPELFKRVEILQGSASALYGSDALGGVVTFTTRAPEDYGLTSAQPFALGSRLSYRTVDDSWGATASAAVAAGPLSALVVYSHREGSESKNRGTVAPNPESLESDALLAKLVWKPSALHRLELSLENYDRFVFAEADNREGPGQVGNTLQNTVASDTQRFRLGALWNFTPGEGRHPLVDALEVRLSLQDAVARDTAIEKIAFNPPSAANGTFRDRVIVTAFNNDTLAFTAAASKRLAPAHRLAYGLDVSRTDTDKPWRSTVTNSRGTTTPDEPRMAATETNRLGVYLQHEADWILASGRRFSVIPGLRVDQFELTPDNSPLYLATTAGARAPGFDEAAVTPKLGVVLGLTRTLNAYAHYNRGFRCPTAEDLTATFTNAVSRYRTLPNPALREETSDAYEVGVKGRVGRALTVRAAAFLTDYADFIEQIAFASAAAQDFVNWPSGTFQTQNRAGARIYGAELWTRLALGEVAPELAAWSVTASVGHSKGTFANPGAARVRLASVEPLKATAILGYAPPRGRFGATLAVEAVQGGRPGAATQFYAPSHTVLDASATWRAHERLTLALGLHNLTDEKYWRYGSVRGVAATNLREQERRTQPGFHAAFSAALRY